MTDETEEPRQTFQVRDRRFWVDEDTAAEDAPAPKPKYPSFVEELRARTETAEQKLKEKIDLLEPLDRLLGRIIRIGHRPQ